MKKISHFVMPNSNENVKQTNMDTANSEKNHCCAAAENLDHVGHADIDESDTEDEEFQNVDDDAAHCRPDTSSHAQTQSLQVENGDEGKVDKKTVENPDDGEVRQMAENEEKQDGIDDSNAYVKFVSVHDKICGNEKSSGSSDSDGSEDKTQHEGKEISGVLEENNEVQDSGEAR